MPVTRDRIVVAARTDGPSASGPDAGSPMTTSSRASDSVATRRRGCDGTGIGNRTAVGPSSRPFVLPSHPLSLVEHLFYSCKPRKPAPDRRTMATIPYAELHAHTNFSFLDGASPPDDLVERAVAIGLTGLAVTDHNGLYGAVRFVSAAEAVGIHPVVGLEIELLDPVVADPSGIVIPPRRPRRRGQAAEHPGLGAPGEAPSLDPTEGRPVRPRPTRTRLPGHRLLVKEDLRGIGERVRGPHLV